MPVFDSDSDPRLSSEYIRHFEGTVEGDGEVVLVGVVHDHPASQHRVREVVTEVAPDVLALELPPVAVPLFERYAEDSSSPPVFGGEMSAAIQVADESRIVGIDGPSTAFAGRLARRLVRERAAAGTVRDVAESFTSVSRNAVVCRGAAMLSTLMSRQISVDSSIEHDCEWSDAPDVQAADEKSKIQKSKAVLNAFEGSAATQLQDGVREAHMSAEVSRLRQDGDVVAIVGIGHLDALTERLR